jgi:ABC-type branched-subunit amino acid transport system ATPase component/ABC-type branched-subunit amino acid transport system permease subunit
MKNRAVLVTVALILLLVWPQLPGVPYDFINTAIIAAENLVVALSLVLLIGMVGQISLAQASFVGMGAFVSALTVRDLGLQFPLILIVGIAAGAVIAILIGAVALRVRGLYLAAATLIFGYVCDKYLFTQEWLVQSASGTSIPPEVVGTAGTLPYFDLADAHIFYYIALAVALLVLYSLANLRESRVGRAFAALRGSEIAAASLGVDVMRFKLIGFATSGAIAGLGGSLLLVGQRAITPAQFNVLGPQGSLFYLSLAVVGGLRSLGGAIASSALFALLVGEVFFRFPPLADYLTVITGSVLVVVLLFFPGGISALGEKVAPRLRDLGPRLARGADAVWNRMPMVRAGRALDRVTTRLGTHIAALFARLVPQRAARADSAEPATADSSDVSGIDIVSLARAPVAQSARITALPVAAAAESGDETATHVELISNARSQALAAGTPGVDGRRYPVLMEANDITVRFGGLTAVNAASIKVGAGEIVGLIGPNGAGKTTLFNAVLGLNSPANGKVSIHGRDVTGWPVHRRAALGVGRTFQVLQLFGDMTVYDNLLVATHLQNKTGLFGSILVTPGARYRERRARDRVDAALRLMQLEDFADRKVAGLPFGTLRLIEVARTLVTGAPLVCFDEPASGLDTAETERLIEWFRFLRDIGVTLLVIEHDVPMVMRLCDYVYVLDQGQLIAEGTPAEVQRNHAVVAAYLGSEEQEAV